MNPTRGLPMDPLRPMWAHAPNDLQAEFAEFHHARVQALLTGLPERCHQALAADPHADIRSVVSAAIVDGVAELAAADIPTTWPARKRACWADLERVRVLAASGGAE